MKPTQKLSLFSLEEARKKELLTNFLDPSLNIQDLLSEITLIKFEELFLDWTWFNEWSTVFNLHASSLFKYRNILSQAFSFYSQDMYLHTRELINKNNDYIKREELTDLVDKYGWFNTLNQTMSIHSNLPFNQTLNGNNILEVDKYEAFDFKASINIGGKKTTLDNKCLVFSDKNSESFTIKLMFDHPVTINTLLLPFFYPLPKYIESIIFKNIAGQAIYSIDDVTPYSNDYQAEFIFPPITVHQILFSLKNVPLLQNTEDSSFTKSFIQTLSNITNKNKEVYIGSSDTETTESYHLPVCISCYPLLRKYKRESVIRIPLNYNKPLKAVMAYWDEIKFNGTGIVSSNALTNIEVDFVIQKDNNLSFQVVTNYKNFKAVQEKFLYVDKDFLYSLTKTSPIKNITMNLRKRNGEDIQIGYWEKDQYLRINYPRKQTVIMRYEFNTEPNFLLQSSIDEFGSLVFKDVQNPTNCFLNVKLARCSNDPYLTPILKYIVCGLIK